MRPRPRINAADPSDPIAQGDHQSKRILWIIPNYRAVSKDAQLPPLSFKQQSWLATEDTFDYSDFIFVGALSGISMAQKSEPSFGQGGAGYGRYYWRVFADVQVGRPVLATSATRHEYYRYRWLGRAELPRRGRVRKETCRLIHIVPTPVKQDYRHVANRESDRILFGRASVELANLSKVRLTPGIQ